MSMRTLLLERLYDGISEIVDSGRLGESDLPDDHGWLANLLVQIDAATEALDTPPEEPAKHRPCTNWAKPGESTGSKLDLARDLGRAYHAMYEGVRDMVDSPMPGLMGRLTRADIPDDYDWLINTLASIEALNSERATAC